MLNIYYVVDIIIDDGDKVMNKIDKNFFFNGVYIFIGKIVNKKINK